MDNSFVQKIGFTQMLGWKARIGRSKNSYLIYLPKQVIFACGLRQGDEICTYFSSDKSNRPILVVYFDKRDIEGAKRND